MRVVHGYARVYNERRDDEATAGGSCVVLYQLATNTAIPDDKGERVAGVRGQPGPVAGVQPINVNGNRHGGRTPPRDRSRRLSFVFLTSEDAELPVEAATNERFSN